MKTETLNSCDTPRERRPRERIIETARDLFRRHGLRGVGVETIAEAAGTNKMTLYRHFSSKDDLIVACLSEAAVDLNRMWAEFEADHPGDPMAQLQEWVQGAAECAVMDTRGCDLANAAVELTEIGHPARKVIAQFKIDQRNRLAELCKAAKIPQADLLADTLYLLIEGARVSSQSIPDDGPAHRFIDICNAVIASFQGRPLTCK
ncbi:MAG TPA: TetR/AcrR family transcriptional regulator [Methylovirgula sp.]|jgi:AcrR family transcriptional regulator|nr:TetR/AcrR family transcriptional regulator [Methylovirgula sp.]